MFRNYFMWCVLFIKTSNSGKSASNSVDGQGQGTSQVLVTSTVSANLLAFWTERQIHLVHVSWWSMQYCTQFYIEKSWIVECAIIKVELLLLNIEVLIPFEMHCIFKLESNSNLGTSLVSFSVSLETSYLPRLKTICDGQTKNGDWEVFSYISV